MGAFGSHFDGLGGQKAAVEVQEPPGRGLVSAGSVQGRLGRRFWLQVDPNMGPSWAQNQSKKRCKNDSFSCVFPTLLGLILDPKMGPCWDQVGTKIGSRANPGPTLGQPDPFLVALGPPQRPLGPQTFQNVAEGSPNGPQTTTESTKITIFGINL